MCEYVVSLLLMSHARARSFATLVFFILSVLFVSEPGPGKYNKNVNSIAFIHNIIMIHDGIDNAMANADRQQWHRWDGALVLVVWYIECAFKMWKYLTNE